MSTDNQVQATTQIYRVYIKASPQAVWEAITRPEWTERYGYGGRVEYDLRPGGSFTGFTSQAMRQGGAARGIEVPEVAIEGQVIAVEAPHRLVLKWHMVMDRETTAESFTQLTYEIEETQAGITKLTLIHELDGAPHLAAILSGTWEDQGAGGGWRWVLSDLKSLLETGHGLMG